MRILNFFRDKYRPEPETKPLLASAKVEADWVVTINGQRSIGLALESGAPFAAARLANDPTHLLEFLEELVDMCDENELEGARKIADVRKLPRSEQPTARAYLGWLLTRVIALEARYDGGHVHGFLPDCMALENRIRLLRVARDAHYERKARNLRAMGSDL